MSTFNFRSTLLVIAAAILFFTISSCRTHNGGRACPSYGSVVKTEKQA